MLAAADDLVLDIPDAVRLLSLFLGRAIVDEVGGLDGGNALLAMTRGPSLV